MRSAVRRPAVQDVGHNELCLRHVRAQGPPPHINERGLDRWGLWVEHRGTVGHIGGQWVQQRGTSGRTEGDRGSYTRGMWVKQRGTVDQTQGDCGSNRGGLWVKHRGTVG